MLASVTVAAPTPAISFEVYAVGGFGAGMYMASSLPDTDYFVPSSEVAQMYNMIHNPSSYTSHGPLRVAALDWISDYYSLTSNHTEFAHDGVTLAASITGSLAVLNTPWQSVLLRRSADKLAVSIYDTQVPEPSTKGLVIVALMVWVVIAEYKIWRLS